MIATVRDQNVSRTGGARTTHVYMDFFNSFCFVSFYPKVPASRDGVMLDIHDQANLQHLESRI